MFQKQPPEDVFEKLFWENLPIHNNSELSCLFLMSTFISESGTSMSLSLMLSSRVSF